MFCYPLKRHPHRRVKHTQTIRRQFADEFTVWNLSKYGAFSGPYFPEFRLNRIQCECGKIRTRKYWKVIVWVCLTVLWGWCLKGYNLIITCFKELVSLNRKAIRQVVSKDGHRYNKYFCNFHSVFFGLSMVLPSRLYILYSMAKNKLV